MLPLMIQITKDGAWYIDKGNGNTQCSKAWNILFDTVKPMKELKCGVKVCKICLENWRVTNG